MLPSHCLWHAARHAVTLLIGKVIEKWDPRQGQLKTARVHCQRVDTVTLIQTLTSCSVVDCDLLGKDPLRMMI
jgi:hypothetical protein